MTSRTDCMDALRIACDKIDEQDAELDRARADHRHAKAYATHYRETLEEVLEECKDQYDIEDGDDGRPLPNRWMKLGNLIEEALARIVTYSPK